MATVAVEQLALEPGTQVTRLEALNPSADRQSVAAFEQALNHTSSTLDGGLLNKIGNMKERFDRAKEELKVSLSTTQDDPSALLQMQWSLMRITLQEEMIAKTTMRLTQNVETLMKAQ